VKPGRHVYLAVVDLSTSTTYPVFTGIVDDIVPNNRPGGGTVDIECVDYMAVLNDQSLSFTAADQNIDLTGAFQILLADAQYPGGWALDTDTQPVVVFGVTDKNAGQVAHSLADAGMGSFFVDALGNAKFYARSHTYPVATALDQAVCLDEIMLTQPWSDVYNYVTAVTSRPIRKQPAVIYFLSGPVQLAAGVPVVFDVDYKSSFNVQLGTYAAWTDKTGTGTDKTANTTITPVLGYNGGTITAVCTADAWLTKLEIRGSMWDMVEEKKVSTDATSVTAYGLRRFFLDSPFLQDPNYATNHAGIIKAFAKDDRESVTVQIEGREDLQFGFELMTPVAFTSTTLDIDSTYYVMNIKHDWLKTTGQAIVTTLGLSKIITDSTAVTAAPILSEPAEAPPGYDDPGGDPGNPANDVTDLGFEAVGDILVGSDDEGAWDNLAVGTDAQVLVADSGEALGIKWADLTTVAASGQWFGAPYLVGYTSDGTYAIADNGGDNTFTLIAGGYPNVHEGILLEADASTLTSAALIAPHTGTIEMYNVFLMYMSGSGGGNFRFQWNVQTLSADDTTYSDGHPGSVTTIAVTNSQNKVVYSKMGTTYDVTAGDVVTCRIVADRNSASDTAGDSIHVWALAIKYTV